MKKRIIGLILLLLALPVSQVFAVSDGNTYPVLSRGHIENVGDYPTDGSWVASPDRIGTVGESKRIEGFELKLGDDLPADMEIRYNVHVQNKGWLYDEEDFSDWPQNGDYAGTRGEGLRIEAIKIVLTDAEGNIYPGYHIDYRGHVQNIGDVPENSDEWYTDGDQLGTVGSSLRLEALTLQIVKDDANAVDLSAYNSLLSQIDDFNAADYTETSWNNLQTALSENKVSDENSQEEIKVAVDSIQNAVDLLENLVTSTVYDAAGTYGPESGSQTIDSDVIITASGVILQNLEISGNLIIDKGVGDGDVTLNNVTVNGELRIRGGGQNSIHINGGQYANISVEQTPTGTVRIVTTDLSGTAVVIGEIAAGEEVILEGAFDQVTVSAPNAVVTTRGNTNIADLNLTQSAADATVNLGSNSTITNLTVSGESANIKGTGTVQNADVKSDSAVFEKAPVSYTVDDGVEIPPVMPTPDNGGGTGGGGGGGVSRISLSVTTAPTVSFLKTYDGTSATNVTAAAVDPSNISGIVSGDDVTVLATATYDNKNAGDNKTITVSYTLSGTNASKYSAPASSTITTLGRIDKKQLDSPASPTATKEYDGTATLESTITDDLGQIAGDDLTIRQTITCSDSKAVTNSSVTCSYILSGGDKDNYTGPSDQSGTITITPKPVTITGASVEKSKTYDGTAAANVTSVGTTSDFIDGDAVSITAVAAYQDSSAGSDAKNAGTGKTIKISYFLTGDSAGNYQITDSAASEITGASIQKRQLTIAAADVPTPVAKAYDGTTDVFTAVNNSGKIYNNTIVPENVITADTSNVIVKANAAYADKNAATGKAIAITYSLSGSAAGNYLAPANDNSKTDDIRPLTLTFGSIDTASITKDYDGSSSGQLSIGINCPTNMPLFINDVNTEHTLVISTVSTYYTDSGCTAETSQPGTNLGLKYTITLGGASGGNYVFSNNSSVWSGTTDGGTINAMPLTINTDFIQTEKTYDGTTTVYSNDATPVEISDYTVDSSKIGGLVSGEAVDVKLTASYADENAGDAKTITLGYTLSGASAGHYTLANGSLDTGKINPIQLTYGTTPFTTNDGSKTYDGTTIVRYNGNFYDNYNKNSGGIELKYCVTGLLLADQDYVTVKATATVENKDAGEKKPVTFSYSIEGSRAGNYLAPVSNDSSGVTAKINRRILYYANLNVETIKKYDNSSAAQVKTANLDLTTSHGVDTGVVYKAPATLDDVALNCTAAYYAGGQETASVGTDIEIRLNPILTGADAANYQMVSETTTGSILPGNGLITNNGSSTWGQIYAYYQTLTPRITTAALNSLCITALQLFTESAQMEKSIRLMWQ
ncbi:YDG domain-containing protein [Eubacteriaceae bacterium ES2]|nr:YDG domain-containing protein [Eubacteriaceae bacterium ES2]